MFPSQIADVLPCAKALDDGGQSDCIRTWINEGGVRAPWLGWLPLYYSAAPFGAGALHVSEDIWDD